MPHTITNSRCHRSLFLFLFINILLLSGCTSSNQPSANLQPRDSTPQVLSTEVLNLLVDESDIVSCDFSNISKGYMHFTYKGTNEKVKYQIITPKNITYTYLVTNCTSPTVFPLSGGDGDYTFVLLESVDAKNNKYAIRYTKTLSVVLENEFLPFLTPNVYVNYNLESIVVEQSVSLSQECFCDLDVISNIYHYVTEHIRYDTKKAQTVAYGYIPNPDETLTSGSGICFDYASLMTAMLRIQHIPTRLEVGYAQETYHAWISCYIAEIGWIDNIIEFDGKNWSLMDPTLAASNTSSSVKKYIGDGSQYLVKYTY